MSLKHITTPKFYRVTKAGFPIPEGLAVQIPLYPSLSLRARHFTPWVCVGVWWWFGGADWQHHDVSQK